MKCSGLMSGAILNVSVPSDAALQDQDRDEQRSVDAPVRDLEALKIEDESAFSRLQNFAAAWAIFEIDLTSPVAQDSRPKALPAGCDDAKANAQVGKLSVPSWVNTRCANVTCKVVDLVIQVSQPVCLRRPGVVF